MNTRSKEWEIQWHLLIERTSSRIPVAAKFTLTCTLNLLLLTLLLTNVLDLQKECASMMQDLSEKINNKHHEVHTHPLLSIFKMAEVEVRMPYSNESAISRSPSALLLVLLAFVGLLNSICPFGSWQRHQKTTRSPYRKSPSRRIARMVAHVAPTRITEPSRARENPWPWKAQINEEKGFCLLLDLRADLRIDRRIRTAIPPAFRRSRIALTASRYR